MREHISYSELKIWNECAYKHKVKYLDRVKGFKGNEHTLFGTAVHDVCEKALLTGSVDLSSYFLHRYLREVEKIKSLGVELKPDLLCEMEAQGKSLVPAILPAVNEAFKRYNVISTEEELYESIDGSDIKFKGYIDLVLKVDDTYHIIDWKTCSWGWNARKKNDKILGYQLVLYKYFFSRKHGIDLKKIETHFALLKRTAKKERVEIFRVSSGNKKVENALNLLNRANYNIAKHVSIKNRMSCKMCEFFNTEHCT